MIDSVAEVSRQQTSEQLPCDVSTFSCPHLQLSRTSVSQLSCFARSSQSPIRLTMIRLRALATVMQR